MATIISCPYCGKRTDPRLDSCVHCGGDLSKHRETLGKSEPPKQAPTAQKGSPTCPSCGALVQQGDIICVACGTNLMTGRPLRETAPEVTTVTAPAPESQTGRIVAIAAAVAALVLIAVAIWALTRDPVRTAEKLYAEGRRVEAIEQLDEYLQENPEDSRAHFAVGRIHWLEGDPGEAATAFAQAYANQANWAEAARLAAVSYMRAENSAALGKAEQVLEDWVQRENDNPEAWAMLAQVRAAQEDYAGQAAALDEVLRIDPLNREALLGHAAALALAGSLNEAAQGANQAAQFAGDDAGLAHVIEALVAAAMESPYQLEPAIEQALASDAPMRAETQTLRGMLLLSNGQLADGEEAFKQALAADSEYDAARFFRAVSALALDFPGDALPAFDKLREGSGPFAGQAAAMAARIYLERGELASAQETIDQALTLSGESAAIRTIQARIAAAQGDGAAAGESLRKAMALDPDYAPAHLEAGLLYVRRGLIEDGLTELRAYLDRINQYLPDAGAEEVKALIAQLEANTGAGTAGATEGS